MRPIVHTFGSFLVERAFEQVKLGFGHQDVGGVLVGVGRLVRRRRRGGRTHQAPGDVALLDTLPGWIDPRARRRPTRSTRCCGARSPATGCTTCGWSSRPTPSRSRDARPLPRRTPRGRARRSSRSGRCSTRCWPPTEGLRRHRALRPHGAAVRRARRCARCWRRPRSCWSSRGWPARRRAWSPTRCATCPHRLLALGVGREELRRYGTAERPRPRPRPRRRRAARARSTGSSPRAAGVPGVVTAGRGLAHSGTRRRRH